MSFTTLDPRPEPIPRDRFKRPLLVPPGGGKPTAYRRGSKHGECLANRYNLERWQERAVAVGLADRPDLMLAVAAHRDDKNELNNLCSQAKEAAKSSAAATTGTAIHALCEQHDRGQEIRAIPDTARADLDAYIQATKELHHRHIEQFMVCDELKVAGTPDRISEYQGDTYIADIKTGATLDFSWLEISVQLAVYSRSLLYHHPAGTREPIKINQDRALVIHAPAGKGEAHLLWVDLNAGWDAALLAHQVWEIRKKKNLAWPIEDQMSVDDIAGSFGATPADLPTAIATAASVDDLTALWRKHQHEWTGEHTRLAATRKNILLGHAA